jgi:hypothetical protein
MVFKKMNFAIFMELKWKNREKIIGNVIFEK